MYAIQFCFIYEMVALGFNFLLRAHDLHLFIRAVSIRDMSICDLVELFFSHANSFWPRGLVSRDKPAPYRLKELSQRNVGGTVFV